MEAAVGSRPRPAVSDPPASPKWTTTGMSLARALIGCWASSTRRFRLRSWIAATSKSEETMMRCPDCHKTIGRFTVTERRRRSARTRPPGRVSCRARETRCREHDLQPRRAKGGQLHSFGTNPPRSASALPVRALPAPPIGYGRQPPPLEWTSRPIRRLSESRSSPCWFRRRGTVLIAAHRSSDPRRGTTTRPRVQRWPTRRSNSSPHVYHRN